MEILAISGVWIGIGLVALGFSKARGLAHQR